jgi:hypothetical protein
VSARHELSKLMGIRAWTCIRDCALTYLYPSGPQGLNNSLMLVPQSADGTSVSALPRMQAGDGWC